MDKNISTTSSSRTSFSSEIYAGAPAAPASIPAKILVASSFRTMKSDLLRVAKNQSDAPVLVAPKVEKRGVANSPQELLPNNELRETPDAPRPIGRALVVLILILILFGGGFLFKLLWPKIIALEIPNLTIPSFGNSGSNKKVAPPLQEVGSTPMPSLLPASSEKRIVITNNKLDDTLLTISSERGKTIPENTLKNISIVEEVFSEQGGKKIVSISANRFIMFTGISTPEILTRSLEGPFMVGFMGTTNTSSPFIILNVSEHDTGFIGMYEWEKNMPKFFDAVFGTNLEIGMSPATKFRDAVVLGRDARILEIYPGVGIAYIFANPSTIIMATNKDVLEKLVSKIAK